MTDAAVLAAGDQATLPGPGTLVLAIRPLRPAPARPRCPGSPTTAGT